MALSFGDLEPDVAELAKALFLQAEKEGMSLSFSSTRRTCAQQNAFYQESISGGTYRTGARGCRSWHIWGRAFDVSIVSGQKDYDRLGAIGKSLGMIWGGDFSNFPGGDKVHFEYHPGLRIADVCPDPDACTDGASIRTPVEVTMPGAKRIWRMVGDYTEVRAEGESFTLPVLTGGGAAVFDNNVMRWAPLALREGARTGVPAAWILGLIYEESGGDANAHASDGGLGLMQITDKGLKQGLSDGEVMLPENNVRLGADFLATLMRANGRDFPKISASFNHGSVRSSANCAVKKDGSPGLCSGKNDCPWGLCEAIHHGDISVAAANLAVDRLQALPPEANPPPPGSIARISDVVPRRSTGPNPWLLVLGLTTMAAGAYFVSGSRQSPWPSSGRRRR